jgi:hypothetical protein
MEKQEKSGFVYIWYDRKHKRYYVGCHWGFENDGYICSSNWMRDAYNKRKSDFKRRIIKRNLKSTKIMYEKEQRYLDMIKPEEKKIRYYNLRLFSNTPWHTDAEKVKSIGEKISIAKKGKSTGPCSPEKAKNISEAKKKNFANRGGMTEEHKKAMSEAKKGTKRSEEAKRKTTETLKKRWANGEMNRPRAKPKVVMTPQ